MQIEVKETTEIIEEDRWLWTTGSYNDLYYSVNDMTNTTLEIPVGISYKITDNTTQNTEMDDNSSTLYDLMIKPEAFDEKFDSTDYADNKLDSNKLQLNSVTTYSGTLKLQFELGTVAGSPFTLDSNIYNSNPILHLSLSDGESTDTSCYVSCYDSENNEIKMDNTSVSLKLDGVNSKTNESTVTLSSSNTTTNITLKNKETWNTVIENLATTTKEATVLTPIYYEKQDGVYNVFEVYGNSSQRLSKTLIFNTSDDTSESWKIGWY